MSGNFRQPTPQPSNDLTPAANFVWAVIFLAVFTTVGWNYGITEIIQNLGGPDANINILEGLFTAMFVRVLTKR